MATSLATTKPIWLAGGTYDNDGGNDLRGSAVVPFFYDVGVSTGGTSKLWAGVTNPYALVVTAAGGMTVAVGPGSFVVPNTANSTAGGYAATLVQAGNLTLANADPSNPRIDIIVAGVTDNGNSTSSGFVAAVTGTASASPSVPAAPANSVIVAQVTVPAGATSITGGNITGNYNFTAAAGGIVSGRRGDVPGYYGQLAYSWPDGVFYHNSGGGAVQMRTLPWLPVTVITTASYSLPTSAAVVPGLSATVTCDGQTDLKVTVHIGGFTGLTSGTTYVTVGAYVDGTAIGTKVVRLDNTLNAQGGTDLVAYTSSVTANTPASGSHTVTVQAWSSAASGGSPAIHAFSGVPAAASMRVEPVAL